MNTLRRQLGFIAAAAAAVAALAGAAQAQTQSSGGMVGGGNPGPGFMGAGSGSSGTVDGGVQGGPRDTSPGESRKRVTRSEARAGAGHLTGPRAEAGVPEVAGMGVDGAPLPATGASAPARVPESTPATPRR